MAIAARPEKRNLFFRLGNDRQPFSPMSVAKHSRLQGATAVDGVCPYCAVGCAQQVWVKDGQIIDVEGDPRSPINEGTLCPKGANTFQLTVNPHRPQKALYRAPYSDQWEEKSLDWMMDRIAERVKETRDAHFVERDAVQRLHFDHGLQHGGGASGGLSLPDEGA